MICEYADNSQERGERENEKERERDKIAERGGHNYYTGAAVHE